MHSCVHHFHSLSRPLITGLKTVVLVVLFQAVNLPAQTAVTGISYGTLTDNANTTSGGITYLNRDRTVSTVSTATLGTYRFDGPLANNVYFRRNTDSNGNGTANQTGSTGDNPNNTTLIYQVNGSAQDMGNYQANAANVFLDSNLYAGIRNPFANGAGTSANSNIERIDFSFTGGYTVQASDALVFFDVENTGNFGDGFRIAAYTAVGTVNGFSNAPTAYANTGLLVAPDSFGGPITNPEGGSTATYYRSTFSNGDNLSGTASGTTGGHAAARRHPDQFRRPGYFSRHHYLRLLAHGRRHRPGDGDRPGKLEQRNVLPDQHRSRWLRQHGLHGLRCANLPSRPRTRHLRRHLHRPRRHLPWPAPPPASDQ
jgi:hypothetical protein